MLVGAPIQWSQPQLRVRLTQSSEAIREGARLTHFHEAHRLSLGICTTLLSLFWTRPADAGYYMFERSFAISRFEMNS